MKQNKVKYIASWATVGKKLNENLPLTNKNTLKSKILMILALVTNSSWNCQKGKMKEYNRTLRMRRWGSTKFHLILRQMDSNTLTEYEGNI